MITFLYLFGVIFTMWYFCMLYKFRPWDERHCSKEFRYRIKKISKIYSLTRENKYVIYRKYGSFPPWFIVKDCIASAKDAAIILSNLKEADKIKSFKEKNEWLSDDEFLAEIL